MRRNETSIPFGMGGSRIGSTPDSRLEPVTKSKGLMSCVKCKKWYQLVQYRIDVVSLEGSGAVNLSRFSNN